MKVYISGKISGDERAREKFAIASGKLSNEYAEVVNPMENGLPPEASWEMHMAVDVMLLLSCDAVYMLPDWRDSRGATIEKKLAEHLGKKVVYAEHPGEDSDILDAIEELIGVTLSDMRNESREEVRVNARLLYSQFCAERGIKNKDIAIALRRDVSTVSYYQQRAHDLYRYNGAYLAQYNGIKNLLKK